MFEAELRCPHCHKIASKIAVFGRNSVEKVSSFLEWNSFCLTILDICFLCYNKIEGGKNGQRKR